MSENKDHNNEEIINKLSILPKNEIVYLINFIYKNKKEQLINLIYSVFHTKTKDPYSKLNNLSKENLLNIVRGIKELPESKIDELYNEYYQTQNPSLYFCEIKDINNPKFFDITKKEQEIILSSLIEKKINFLYNQKIKPEFKNFLLKNIEFKLDVLEIEFEFQSRIDYIDTEEKLPTSVYGLEEGIIWVSKKQNAIIVKTKRGEIATKLTNVLESAFKGKVIKFNLTKEIVNEIFPPKTLRRAGYIEPNSGGSKYIERKTLSDTNFASKEEGKQTDERCERPYSYHKIEWEDLDFGTAVNEKGKITINKHLKKSELKSFSINIIREIVRNMGTLKKEDISKYLKGIDKNSLYSLREISSSSGKEYISQLAIAIKNLKEGRDKSVNLRITSKDIYNSLSPYLITVFTPSCNECGDTSCKCSKCGELNSIIVKKGSIKLKCDNCGKIIEDVSKDIKCPNDDNHVFDGTVEENVTFYSTKDLFRIINNLSEQLNLDLNLNDEGVVRIKNSNVIYNLPSYKILYLMDELKSFKNITKLLNISNEIKKTQLENLKFASEKCSNHEKENCRNCIIDQKGLCIQRLVASFPQDAKLHAHCGHEYGDISWIENIENKNISIVGLAKSSLKKYDEILTLKNNKGSSLFAQAYDFMNDNKIEFIAIIASADIDERLRESLIQIAKWNNKRIVFFQREELIRLTNDYIFKLNKDKKDMRFWEMR